MEIGDGFQTTLKSPIDSLVLPETRMAAPMMKSNGVMTSRELEAGRLSRRDVLSCIGVAVAGAEFLPAAVAEAFLKQTPGAHCITLLTG